MTQPVSVEEAQRALGRAKVEEAREQQRIEERAKAAKVQSDGARNQVRAYADQVAQAVKTAAAIKPAPPAPWYIRTGARLLLHGGGQPRWGLPDQVDATLEQLFQLHQRGLWLHTDLQYLDGAGISELDVAECAAWGAMIARAKIVAGESST